MEIPFGYCFAYACPPTFCCPVTSRMPKCISSTSNIPDDHWTATISGHSPGWVLMASFCCYLSSFFNPKITNGFSHLPAWVLMACCCCFLRSIFNPNISNGWHPKILELRCSCCITNGTQYGLVVPLPICICEVDILCPYKSTISVTTSCYCFNCDKFCLVELDTLLEKHGRLGIHSSLDI